MTHIGKSATAHTIKLPERKDAVVKLSWAGATDTGHRRAANEDSYVVQPPVFAVADGMGGHASGDVASAAVVTRLAEIAGRGFATTADVDRALVKATDDIEVATGDNILGVGTTVSGAVLTIEDGVACFGVFNVGDSRVYRFERNELRQVTVDHSVVQEMVDSGLIDRDQAENHPDSNVITRAVGFNAAPIADYWNIPLEPGLRLLVCTDGLTKEIGDARLRLHLAAGLSPAETANALVDAALAAGGRDNVTLVVVDVLEAPTD